MHYNGALRAFLVPYHIGQQGTIVVQHGCPVLGAEQLADDCLCSHHAFGRNALFAKHSLVGQQHGYG